MRFTVPPVQPSFPDGRCFCGCGETTKPGKFFVITHDRRAESRVIRERFGNIATFVAWAEENLPAIPEEEQVRSRPGDAC